MAQTPAQIELIDLINKYNARNPTTLGEMIYEMTDQLQVNYPIEDDQLLINEFNQTLAGIWQQVLFESDLKYGEAYLEELTEIESLELSKHDLTNQKTIQQNGSQNWYYFNDDQLRLANINDIIEAINTVDVDFATENAANWDEVECTPALQAAIGLNM